MCVARALFACRSISEEKMPSERARIVYKKWGAAVGCSYTSVQLAPRAITPQYRLQDHKPTNTYNVDSSNQYHRTLVRKVLYRSCCIIYQQDGKTSLAASYCRCQCPYHIRNAFCQTTFCSPVSATVVAFLNTGTRMYFIRMKTSDTKASFPSR